MLCVEEADATCPQCRSVSAEPLAVIALGQDRENGLVHRNGGSAGSTELELLWRALHDERFHYKAPLGIAAMPPAQTRCKKRRIELQLLSLQRARRDEWEEGWRQSGRLWVSFSWGKEKAERWRTGPCLERQQDGLMGHVSHNTCTFSLILYQKTRHEALSWVAGLGRAPWPSRDSTLFL